MKYIEYKIDEMEYAAIASNEIALNRRLMVEFSFRHNVVLKLKYTQSIAQKAEQISTDSKNAFESDFILNLTCKLKGEN